MINKLMKLIFTAFTLLLVGCNVNVGRFATKSEINQTSVPQIMNDKLRGYYDACNITYTLREENENISEIISKSFIVFWDEKFISNEFTKSYLTLSSEDFIRILNTYSYEKPVVCMWRQSKFPNNEYCESNFTDKETVDIFCCRENLCTYFYIGLIKYDCICVYHR